MLIVGAHIRLKEILIEHIEFSYPVFSKSKKETSNLMVLVLESMSQQASVRVGDRGFLS